MATLKYKEDRYYTTLKTIYLGYRHKWYDVTSSTVPVPYFPKSEISEDVNKLTYKEWRKIILCYFRQVLNYLYDGNTFTLPQQLGSWKLVKVKTLGVDSFKSKKSKKLIYCKNLHTYGYKPRIMWLKRKSWFLYSTFYKFNFAKTAWMEVKRRLFEDGSTILNLDDR